MYRHILVPLDGSQLAEQVLPHVKHLASVGEKPRITLLRAVLRELPDVMEGETTNQVVDPMPRIVERARAYVEGIAESLRAEGFDAYGVVNVHPPADAILEFAERFEVDLIAIVTHGRGGIGRFIFGSVTQKIIHATPVPVLVVRPK
jgi:nucleotide-binding universal stress UspA family protein